MVLGLTDWVSRRVVLGVASSVTSRAVLGLIDWVARRASLGLAGDEVAGAHPRSAVTRQAS